MSEKVIHEWIYEWEGRSSDGHTTKYRIVKEDGMWNRDIPYRYVVVLVVDGGINGCIDFFPPVTSELARLAIRVQELGAVAEIASGAFVEGCVLKNTFDWQKLEDALKKAGYLK